MEFGALMFFTDYAVPATEFAQALEPRGFESVGALPSAKSDTILRPSTVGPS